MSFAICILLYIPPSYVIPDPVHNTSHGYHVVHSACAVVYDSTSRACDTSRPLLAWGDFYSRGVQGEKAVLFDLDDCWLNELVNYQPHAVGLDDT